MRKPSDRKKSTYDEAEILAQKLADKPYDKELKNDFENYHIRKSVNLPADLVDKIELIAFKNKRNKTGIKTFSGIVKKALDEYLLKNKY